MAQDLCDCCRREDEKKSSCMLFLAGMYIIVGLVAVGKHRRETEISTESRYDLR